jgi:hypothetical protein
LLAQEKSVAQADISLLGSRHKLRKSHLREHFLLGINRNYAILLEIKKLESADNTSSLIRPREGSVAQRNNSTSAPLSLA